MPNADKLGSSPAGCAEACLAIVGGTDLLAGVYTRPGVLAFYALALAAISR